MNKKLKDLFRFNPTYLFRDDFTDSLQAGEIQGTQANPAGKMGLSKEAKQELEQSIAYTDSLAIHNAAELFDMVVDWLKGNVDLGIFEPAGALVWMWGNYPEERPIIEAFFDMLPHTQYSVDGDTLEMDMFAIAVDDVPRIIAWWENKQG